MPHRDARDIAAALRELGFDVTLQVDQNRDALRRAIRAFGEKLRTGGGVGLFYFAGHGVQVRGRNYLIPVGATIASEADVEDEAVDAGMVLRQMEYAGNRLNIVILDACRNNPFARSFRSAERGLASIEAPVGTLIAYATAPGSTASDGRGRNGLYTQELLANLRVPGLRVEDVFKRVRAGVRTKSKGQQVPWESSSIEGDYYFIPPKVAARPPVESDEQAAWEVVKSSRRIETVREFLDQYPNGRYAAAARLLLRELTPVETASNPPVDKKAAGNPAVENTTIPAKTGARTGPGGVALASFRFTTVTVNSRGEVSAPRQEDAWGYVEVLPGAVPLEMVEIPGGTFQMGSPAGEMGRSEDEGPQHQVTVPDFYMGKYEVTQAQWRAVMGSNPSHFEGDSLPVEQVSWNDAVEFCAKLSRATGRTYRLPTEAEWEYACRAGTTTPFAFGETITPQLVNYDGNYPYGGAAKGTNRQQTTAVGSLGVANRFGLYDMHGNVWEWCADCWHESYYGAPADGSSWEANCNQNYRVWHGGSWTFYANSSAAPPTATGTPRTFVTTSPGFGLCAWRGRGKVRFTLCPFASELGERAGKNFYVMRIT